MSPQAGDRLYSPLVRAYRPKATGIQIVLIATAILVSSGTVYGHQKLVVQPLQADLVVAPVPYRSWYLANEPAPSMRDAPIGTTPTGDNRAGISLAPAGPADHPSGVSRSKALNPARPNLVPQPGVSYSLPELARKIESYLGGTAAASSRPDLAAKARELAESYASFKSTSVPTFPLSAALERSVLERGWLWDLREGCEAQLYFKLPAGRLDTLGCGLMSVPMGKSFGTGVVWIERTGTGRRPVVVVVWENK